MTTDTIPAGLAVGEFAELLITALQAQFPTVAIRRCTQDGIAIEDEAGHDWELQIHKPERPCQIDERGEPFTD